MNSDEDIRRDWSKLERDARNRGTRDGISDGRDSNFQKGFDDGYYEGFRNGFAQGQYKGALFAQSQLKKLNITKDALLDEPRLGWCQICQNSELLNQSTSSVIEKQTEVANKNLQYLHSLHSKDVASEVPKKL